MQMIGLVRRERLSKMENGEWRMENGEWTMENYERHPELTSLYPTL